MLWNELEYKDQMKVIGKIVTILKYEDDSDIKNGLMAAIHELEIWSNFPCQIIDEPIVAEATDSWSDNDSSY